MVALNYRKDYVQKNKYSRPGDRLLRVQAIVLHYTANRHANAEDHQEYFDGADGGAYRYAGAHIFVDRHEAVQIMPLNEVAYHANEKAPKLSALRATAPYYPRGNANLLTIGVEMCIESDGSFHPDTVARTQAVIRKLQRDYPQLRDTKNRVVRHYDITGKYCPLPYVNEAKWQAFLYGVDHPPKKAQTASKPKPTVESKPKEEGARKLKLHAWQREELAKIFQHVHDEGIFKDDKHVQRVKDGDMTVDEAIFLMTIISGAALNDGKRIK